MKLKNGVENQRWWDKAALMVEPVMKKCPPIKSTLQVNGSRQWRNSTLHLIIIAPITPSIYNYMSNY